MARGFRSEAAATGSLSIQSADPAERAAALFLHRIDRLVKMRAMPQLDDADRRLVDHALYSTYWDCARLGARPRARSVIGMPVASPTG